MAERASVAARGPQGPAPADRERSRDRILTAALEEFAARGFDGTTTSEVARRAGVTQPLVHYHFSTKDQLWREALTPVLDDLVTTFGGAERELADVDPIGRLKVVVRRFVRFSAAHPEFGRILSYEGAVGGPRLEWILAQDASRTLAAFATLLAEGIADGWAKPLPLAHVGTCLAAASAYAFIAHETMRVAYGIDVTDPAVVDTHADTVVELFFHGLVATPPAPGGETGRPAALLEEAHRA